MSLFCLSRSQPIFFIAVHLLFISRSRTAQGRSRTAQGRSTAVITVITRSKKICICSNGSGYPFGKKMLPVRTAAASRSKKICIRSNGLCYPFGKKSYLFERLPLAVQKKSSAVRTAAASRSKKIFTRSNG